MAKGEFKIYDLDGFRLHAYCTDDPLGDASYIIEGDEEVVVLEAPLFRENVAEFQKFLEKLAKPVIASIQDYHLNAYDNAPVVMAEGMPGFMSGPVYSGMMENFAKSFGDAITPVAVDKEARQIPFGESVILAGIPFAFERGAFSDFPAASILIGKQVYYTHWTPARAHMSPLQLNGRAAIVAELESARKEYASGAVLFIGGHGCVAEAGAPAFQIEYLEAVKKALEENPNQADFIRAMEKAFPDLPGKENLEACAAKLYA